MMHRWLIVATLVGCGSGMGAGDDDAPGGGKADSGADAGNHAMPDAAGPIEVTVLPDYWQDPIANLPVVFNAVDGSVIAVEMTDASGHASHAVTEPVSVTVIKPSGNQGTVTLMDVPPGAALRFGSLWTKRPVVATMRATWPPGPSGVPHTYVDVETRCGGFGGYYEQASGTIELDARCTGTIDATATQYFEGDVRAYLSVSGQAIANNGTIAFTGTWTPAPLFQANFTGLPNNTSLSGVLTETYGQERYFDDSDSTRTYSTNGTATLVYRLPPAPGSELHEEVTAYLSSGVGNEVFGRRLAYGDPVGFDLGPALVPNIVTTSYDAATNTVHWTTEPGAPPQVVRAELFYPGADGSYPTWIIVAPGTATSVTPPQLPDSLAQYRVVGTVQGAVELLHVAKSYAEIVGDVDLWYGRSNINFGTVDWQGAPAELTSYVNAVARFP